jgi:hypothetical protein
MVTRVSVIRPYAALPSEGGSNDRYVNLCKKLREAGAEVELLCSDFIHNAKKRRSPADLAANIRQLPFLVQIPALPYRENLSLARIAHEVVFGWRALLHLFGKSPPDVIVVGEPLFYVGWLILIYGFFLRVPVLADVIDLWPEADTGASKNPSGFLRRAAYSLLRRSRGLRLRAYAAVSFVSCSYAEMLNFKSAPVFYWGSELSPDQISERPEDARLTVVYAGSFGIGYDIATCLQAAKTLRAELPDRFRFLFAGSGPQLPAVTEAQRAGDIDYLGVLDQRRLTEIYQDADIGFLPYKAGSMVAMPIKFYDYLNFGLYALTSLDLEADQILAREKIGAHYQAGDANDLVKQLKILDADRILLRQTRGAAVQLSKEFSIGRQYGNFARFVLDHARKKTG